MSEMNSRQLGLKAHSKQGCVQTTKCERTQTACLTSVCIVTSYIQHSVSGCSSLIKEDDGVQTQGAFNHELQHGYQHQLAVQTAELHRAASKRKAKSQKNVDNLLDGLILE